MNKIIIAGSRNFDDYDFLKRCCLFNLSDFNKNQIEIVSGTCKGADKLGERFAKEFNLTLKLFPANWEKFGKLAGFKRNLEMAEYSTHLIAFWDGESKGTKHMIQKARAFGLKTLLFYF